ncbi:phosphoribosylaminoimidazolesuccinocarboxamide synthase [bacterium]|nr:phosphoribosylaminoimidazolesuccinocarboxamide synthase [bacterium]
MNALLKTDLEGVRLFARGKVRDVYDLDDRLLIVATDRISAYDCVMPNGIPEKGEILTAMSLFWFGLTRDIVPNHLITADVGRYPEALRRFGDQLEGRSMLVRKAKRIDIECVVRGYLSGSGWREYRKTGMVCGLRLPEGLRESDRLPEPIFTPATKADSGHDENISFEQTAKLVGEDLARRLREVSIAVYRKARDYADGRGILIADTKFEFGLIDGEVALIDEVLSPDSSRFWPKDRYEPGRPQDSFDKQLVRDYLDTLDWDKTPPAPALPEEIVRRTTEKYREAYQRLVASSLERG